ncbi:MAG: phosphoribosylformylglycinamidine cyclo-ligase [Bdellovibrionota bacterium]
MIDYKKSGVDIQAGDDLVSWLQNPQDKSTTPVNPIFLKSDVPDYRKRVISGIGGFASLFDARFQDMKHPVLVSCTDGVGTKVKLASYFNDFSGVGQDLVAMCANDLICTGGTPLFFLDYYAVGKLDLKNAQEFLTSVKKACEKAHMVLIGGETAEMPGVYQNKDFDCAGFSVGVVDKEKIWGPNLVEAGDVVIGLQSSGFHSNGYSLIRKIFESEYEKYRQWLLEPTRLYVEAAIILKKEYEVHAMAHITGGGIDNLPRVLPENLKARITKWDLPECYQEVQARAKITDQEMRETFNCGIGLMVIIKASQAESAKKRLEANGYKSQILGTIVNKAKDEAHVEWA